jgi:Ni/Fe-hydrogenase subunit HybB-like protein
VWVIGVSCALIFVGIIGVRLNIVIPSLTVEMLHGLNEGLIDVRASAFYFPSWLEVLSSLGVIAANMLLWLVGFSLLPIYDRRLARPAGEPAEAPPPTHG